MACLIVVDGPAAGRLLPLAEHQLVSIGRDEECTFQIVDPQMSRRHLQIRRGQGDSHMAADYRSANGVLINGVKIINETPLKNGDELCAGGSRLVYSTSDYPDARTAEHTMIQRGEWKRVTIMRS